MKFRTRDINSVYFVRQFRISLYTSKIHDIRYQKVFAVLNLVQAFIFLKR
jgi:hypothetical protein